MSAAAMVSGSAPCTKRRRATASARSNGIGTTRGRGRRAGELQRPYWKLRVRGAEGRRAAPPPKGRGLGGG